MIAEIIKNIQGRGPSRPEARIVLDSISPAGDRLTTMEVRMHRFVLAEFNTHRVFSRNSASSRAIPTYTRVRSVLTDLAWPVEWGTLKKGMQAGPEAIGLRRTAARTIWFLAAIVAALAALTLRGLRIHKQITNRLLEPFLWHTVVVSSTEWSNFFAQRSRYYTNLAQPEIAVAADAMHDAYVASEPQQLNYEQWHLPFVTSSDRDWVKVAMIEESDRELTLIALSVARCARSSYDKHNEIGPHKDDLDRYAKLINAKPPHASPLEHVATPAYKHELPLGNFKGWFQWRHYDNREPFDTPYEKGYPR